MAELPFYQRWWNRLMGAADDANLQFTETRQAVASRAAQTLDITERQVNTALPYVAAAGVGLGAALLAQPLGRFGKKMFNGLRYVVTGGGTDDKEGFLEKIPVVGYAFKGLRWVTETLGDYSGMLLGGLASLITFNFFRTPSGGRIGSDPSIGNPMADVASPGLPPVTQEHELRTPQEPPRGSVTLPLAPGSSGPPPATPAGLTPPTIDPTRPLSSLGDQRSQALRDRNRALADHLGALMNNQAQNYESVRNFLGATTTFYNGNGTTPSEAANTRSTLQTMGLTEAEVNNMVGTQPPPVQASIRRDGTDMDPYLYQVGWSLTTILPGVIAVPNGTGAPDLPVTSDNWHDLSVTQRLNYLRRAVPMAQLLNQVSHNMCCRTEWDGGGDGPMGAGRSTSTVVFETDWRRRGLWGRNEEWDLQRFSKDKIERALNDSAMHRAFNVGNRAELDRELRTRFRLGENADVADHMYNAMINRCNSEGRGEVLMFSHLPTVNPDGSTRNYGNRTRSGNYDSSGAWAQSNADRCYTIYAGTTRRMDNNINGSFNGGEESCWRFTRADGTVVSVPMTLTLRHLGALNGNRIEYRFFGETHVAGAGLAQANYGNNGFGDLLNSVEQHMHYLGTTAAPTLAAHTQRMQFLSHNLELARTKGLIATGRGALTASTGNAQIDALPADQRNTFISMRIFPENHAPGATIRPEDTQQVYLVGRMDGDRFIAQGYAMLPGTGSVMPDTAPVVTRFSEPVTLDFKNRTGFEAILSQRAAAQALATNGVTIQSSTPNRANGFSQGQKDANIVSDRMLDVRLRDVNFNGRIVLHTRVDAATQRQVITGYELVPTGTPPGQAGTYVKFDNNTADFTTGAGFEAVIQHIRSRTATMGTRTSAAPTVPVTAVAAVTPAPEATQPAAEAPAFNLDDILANVQNGTMVTPNVTANNRPGQDRSRQTPTGGSLT